MKLYDSDHFALVGVRVTGKKRTNGILCFEGLPSVYGQAKAVCALEDGRVLYAGRNNDIHSRAHRLGTVVTVTGREGVTVTYGRLSGRTVNTGDTVRKGEIIGYEGSSGSGSGSFLTLEFRRNGRRVDGCEYLGIRPEPCVYRQSDSAPADVVCRACGLTDCMRAYIDLYPDSSDLWRRIYNKLSAGG